jgi:hypothetical protein
MASSKKAVSQELRRITNMTTACKYADIVINRVDQPRPREATNKVLEMADEGLISYRNLAMMALKWMSEDDVQSMCQANEIFFEEEE